MFFRAFRRLHVFLRFSSIAYFPALSVDCMFFRASRGLHIFPRFLSIAFFYNDIFHIVIFCFPRFLLIALFASSFQNMTNNLLFSYLQLPRNKVNETVWRPHQECKPILNTIPEEVVYFRHSFWGQALNLELDADLSNKYYKQFTYNIEKLAFKYLWRFPVYKDIHGGISMTKFNISVIDIKSSKLYMHQSEAEWQQANYK